MPNMRPTRLSSLEPSTSSLNRLVATIRNSRSPWKKVVLVTIALAIWCAILWRVVNVFNPGTMLGVFSSDSAIPVLMSNDGRPVTIFNLYYYGAGRWGGWPFLFAQLVRRTTGYHWTDHSLFFVQAVWVFLGVILIGRLSREDRFPVALIYLLTICLDGAVSHRVYDISQVYAWQITSLLLAWYCLRRFLTNLRGSANRVSLYQHAAWGFLSLWFSFLSIWSSFASTPIVFFLLGVEIVRAHLKTKAGSANGAPRQYAWGFALVLAATCAEFVMRINYHRFNLKHYGVDYRTQVSLDFGHLTENFVVQVHNLFKYPWWPYYLLAPLTLLAIAFGLPYLAAEKKSGLLARLREMFVDDILVLIIGSLGIAIINFGLVTVADHVRLNLYDDRFLTLSYLFGSIAGLLSVFWTLRLISNRSALPRQAARATFIVIGLILLTIDFPPVTHNPYYQTDQETAAALAQKAPGAVLMGGYWEAYVLVALQSDHAMTPVPLEGRHLRTPWTPEAIQHTTQIVIEYRRSKFAKAESLPQNLVQYGTPLRLVEPRWYENGEYAFALYFNERK